MESKYCKQELNTADGDGKLIFPIMWEDVDLDSAAGVKFIVAGLNWTFLKGVAAAEIAGSPAFQQLVGALKAALAG